MKSRACRPPALGQDAAPTPAALQQSLPLEYGGVELARGSERSRSPLPVRDPVQHLWFCIWLPQLPLEAVVRQYLAGSGWKDYLQTGTKGDLFHED